MCRRFDAFLLLDQKIFKCHYQPFEVQIKYIYSVESKLKCHLPLLGQDGMSKRDEVIFIMAHRAVLGYIMGAICIYTLDSLLLSSSIQIKARLIKNSA